MITRDFRVECVDARRLDAPMLRRWRELLQHSDAESPFLQPDWTVCCAEQWDGVEVALLHLGDQLVGVLPYQRVGNVGHPVGGTFCDLQTLIAEPSVEPDWSRVLRTCRLSSMRFRHWLNPLPNMAPHVWKSSQFHFIDLSEGFEAYSDSRRGSKRHKLRREIGRSKRRGEDMFGEVAVRWVRDDADVLDLLLQWKRQQSAEMGWSVSFSEPWTRQILWRLLTSPTPLLAGAMAVLYFGEEVAAIEYYLHCGNRLHAWLRAYDAKHAKLSPGNILFWESAQMASDDGVTRIDWGAGDEPFKVRFASDSAPVHDGWLDVWRWRGISAKASAAPRTWLLRPPSENPSASRSPL